MCPSAIFSKVVILYVVNPQGLKFYPFRSISYSFRENSNSKQPKIDRHMADLNVRMPILKASEESLVHDACKIPKHYLKAYGLYRCNNNLSTCLSVCPLTNNINDYKPSVNTGNYRKMIKLFYN